MARGRMRGRRRRAERGDTARLRPGGGEGNGASPFEHVREEIPGGVAALDRSHENRAHRQIDDLRRGPLLDGNANGDAERRACIAHFGQTPGGLADEINELHLRAKITEIFGRQCVGGNAAPESQRRDAVLRVRVVYGVRSSWQSSPVALTSALTCFEVSMTVGV